MPTVGGGNTPSGHPLPLTTAAPATWASAPVLQRLLERQVQIPERSAMLGYRGKREVDRARERTGQIPSPALQRRKPTADPPYRSGRCRASYRVDARESLIQDECQRIEVGGRGGLPSLTLLWRHVGEGAEHVPGTRERLFAG